MASFEVEPAKVELKRFILRLSAYSGPAYCYGARQILKLPLDLYEGKAGVKFEDRCVDEGEGDLLRCRILPFRDEASNQS